MIRGWLGMAMARERRTVCRAYLDRVRPLRKFVTIEGREPIG